MPEVVGSPTIQDGNLCDGGSGGGKDFGRVRSDHLCEGWGDPCWTCREYQCHVVDGRSPDSDHTLGSGRESMRRDDVVLDRWIKIGSVAVRENGRACT